MKLYTQVNFGGNCREAFHFYEKHLGGKITALYTQADLPEAQPMPDAKPDAVLHARIHLGETELVGNDAPRSAYQPMRSAYLYLALDTAEEAERVYALLKEGGEIFMPLAETFFAVRFAMLRDRFGINWTLIRERTR
ncbi:MAG TPA: VOC family protein [Terriglobales bacterium]|nr:VOC family protein [Terriglobales bacterium]